MSQQHDIDDRLIEIREILVSVASGIDQLIILLGEDIRGRNPDAFDRAKPILERKAEEWDNFSVD